MKFLRGSVHSEYSVRVVYYYQSLLLEKPSSLLLSLHQVHQEPMSFLIKLNKFYHCLTSTNKPIYYYLCVPRSSTMSVICHLISCCTSILQYKAMYHLGPQFGRILGLPKIYKQTKISIQYLL